jgi:enamine deaminase RidA (YjgF/YER057c/UK114 family)
MELTELNPGDIYPTGGDYLHGLTVEGAGRIVFVAGTMGLEADGTPGVTLDRQLELIWTNIGRILAEAGMTLANVVGVTSYLTDRAIVVPNQQARLKALDGRAVPTTAIVVTTLSDDWLV